MGFAASAEAAAAERTVSLSSAGVAVEEGRGLEIRGVDRILEICCLAEGAFANRAEESAETAPLLLRAEVEASAEAGP